MLNLAFKRHKTISDKVNKALDTLADTLKKLEPEEITWDEVFADKVKVAGGWADVEAVSPKMDRETVQRGPLKPLDDDDDL